MEHSEQKLQARHNQHIKVLSDAQQRHVKELQTTKVAYRQTQHEAEQLHQTTIKRLQLDHEAALEQAQATCDRQLKEQQAEHASALAQLRAEYDRQLAHGVTEAQTEASQALLVKQADWEAEKQAQHEDVKKLQQQLAALQTGLQAKASETAEVQHSVATCLSAWRLPQPECKTASNTWC